MIGVGLGPPDPTGLGGLAGLAGNAGNAGLGGNTGDFGGMTTLAGCLNPALGDAGGGSGGSEDPSFSGGGGLLGGGGGTSFGADGADRMGIAGPGAPGRLNPLPEAAPAAEPLTAPLDLLAILTLC